MEVTRGDVDGLTEKNIHSILEKLEKTYAAEKEQELQRVRGEHEKTKAALDETAETAQQSIREKDVAGHQAEIKKLRDAETDVKARVESTRDRIDRLADRIAARSAADEKA